MTNISVAISPTNTTNVVVGGTRTFTITATNLNTSTQSVPNIQVVVGRPSSVNIVGTPTPSQGSFSGSIWTIGTLAIGQSVTLPITFQYNARGVAGIFAAISGLIDDVTTNNSVVVYTNVGSPTGNARSATTYTPATLTVTAGTTSTFTITFQKSGPAQATNTHVYFPLPSGVNLISALPSVGSVSGTDWTIGTVTDTTVKTLTLSLQFPQSGIFTLGETFFFTQNDNQPANNSAFSVVKVNTTVQISDINLCCNPVSPGGNFQLCFNLISSDALFLDRNVYIAVNNVLQLSDRFSDRGRHCYSLIAPLSVSDYTVTVRAVDVLTPTISDVKQQTLNVRYPTCKGLTISDVSICCNPIRPNSDFQLCFYVSCSDGAFIKKDVYIYVSGTLRFSDHFSDNARHCYSLIAPSIASDYTLAVRAVDSLTPTLSDIKQHTFSVRNPLYISDVSICCDPIKPGTNFQLGFSVGSSDNLFYSKNVYVSLNNVLQFSDRFSDKAKHYYTLTASTTASDYTITIQAVDVLIPALSDIKQQKFSVRDPLYISDVSICCDPITPGTNFQLGFSVGSSDNLFYSKNVYVSLNNVLQFSDRFSDQAKHYYTLTAPTTASDYIITIQAADVLIPALSDIKRQTFSVRDPLYISDVSICCDPIKPGTNFQLGFSVGSSDNLFYSKNVYVSFNNVLQFSDRFSDKAKHYYTLTAPTTASDYTITIQAVDVLIPALSDIKQQIFSVRNPFFISDVNLCCNPVGPGGSFQVCFNLASSDALFLDRNVYIAVNNVLQLSDRFSDRDRHCYSLLAPSTASDYTVTIQAVDVLIPALSDVREQILNVRHPTCSGLAVSDLTICCNPILPHSDFQICFYVPCSGGTLIRKNVYIYISDILNISDHFSDNNRHCYSLLAPSTLGNHTATVWAVDTFTSTISDLKQQSFYVRSVESTRLQISDLTICCNPIRTNTKFKVSFYVQYGDFLPWEKDVYVSIGDVLKISDRFSDNYKHSCCLATPSDAQDSFISLRAVDVLAPSISDQEEKVFFVRRPLCPPYLSDCPVLSFLPAASGPVTISANLSDVLDKIFIRHELISCQNCRCYCCCHHPPFLFDIQSDRKNFIAFLERSDFSEDSVENRLQQLMTKMPHELF